MSSEVVSLPPVVLAAVGRSVARMHAAAPRRPDYGGAAAMRSIIEQTCAALRSAEGLFEAGAIDVMYGDATEAVKRGALLLEARRSDGWVRECHGDLLLRNIGLVDGTPVLSGAIEFDDRLSCVDVLYDLALLLVDLLQRELPEHANAALNAWMERLRQYDALALLPLYLSMRAATRARALAAAAGSAADADDATRLRDDARSCFASAQRFLQPGAGAIVAIGGLAGSGKTTLATRLAARLGQPPGALVLRSETARKRLFGVDDDERQPPPAYDPSVARSIYQLAAREALDVAHARYVAIVDATLGLEEWRHEMRRTAKRAGVPLIGFWLEAPLEVLEQRARESRGAGSAAAIRVLRQQWHTSSPPADWIRLDATADADIVAEAAMAAWSAAQAGA
jgi:predicted kinase